MLVTCRRFHVDKVSSAHVYLRLKKGETIDTISEGLLEDCAQLVKAHSIQGTSIFSSAIYTPFSLLLFFLATRSLNSIVQYSPRLNLLVILLWAQRLRRGEKDVS
jgi:hypothetical protein